MRLYKFLRDTHKWIGIALTVFILNLAVTGFLLLQKKNADWIQPPTMTGQPGEPAEFIDIQEVLEAVFARNHPCFENAEDIDRIDVRPDKRVFKVRSKRQHAEIQVDAISGDILSTSVRRSDLFEDLHDGSFLGGPVHGWVMPLVALGLLTLAASGLYLWLQPIIRRRNRNSATSS